MGTARRCTLLVASLVVATACTASSPAPSSASSANVPAATGAVGPSAERTIFVATSGDDAAPGSEARPLKTLPAAQSAVRALLAQDNKQSVRVQIAGGTYLLAATLGFDQRDSPADGFTVRYVGPADASAVLTADREITGWEKVSGEIQRAKMPPGLSFATMFENDRRATLARTPNDGYSRVAAAVGPDGSRTQFVYGAGDVPDGIDAPGLTAYLWSGCARSARDTVNYDWEVDVAPVKAIDARTRTITLAEQTAYPICAGNRYFIQGSRTLIDRAGEFALDQGYLYYWPRAAPIEAQRIGAPGLARLVELKGASESALAKNLVLERLTFTRTDGPKAALAFAPGPDQATIHIENAENVAVRGSRIVDVGGSGIELRGHAQRVVIEGDLIDGVGVHGIWIRGPQTGQPRTSKDNRVTNTLIRAGGRLHGSGSGIKIENSAANEISNNDISDMPRYGISLKGVTLPSLQKSLPQLAATQANLNDLRHTRDNVVSRNEISRVVTDSQDAGGIEMWGAGPGNRVEENRVHDVDTGDRRDGFTSTTPERGPILRGVYIDDGSDGALVRGNVIYGIRGPNAAPVMLKGIGSEVSGNVLVDDGGGAAIESAVVDEVPVEALRVTRNVIVRTAGSDAYWWRNFSDKTVGEADRNLFFSASPTVRFRFAGEVLNLDQWRTRYGFDKTSVIADPQFVDAARGDYRVRDGSPALPLGFVNLDPAAVGLRSDFPLKR